MKRSLKYFAAALALITLLLTLVACNKTGNYRNDLDADAVINSLMVKIPVDGGYYEADDDYIDFYFPASDDIIDDDEIMFAKASTNKNQVGVLKAEDGRAEDLKKLCEDYIATIQERWVAQADYTPEEHPKIADAEVRVYGNYVIYAMLHTADREAVFAEAEKLLSNN